MYGFFTAVTIRARKPSLAAGINGAWLIGAVATQSIVVLRGGAGCRNRAGRADPVHRPRDVHDRQHALPGDHPARRGEGGSMGIIMIRALAAAPPAAHITGNV
ncbi:MAG: hypothetical protein Q8M19_20765 [Reyranella sp.]|nr:hypothetical protein [Reyranella sp.]